MAENVLPDPQGRRARLLVSEQMPGVEQPFHPLMRGADTARDMSRGVGNMSAPQQCTVGDVGNVNVAPVPRRCKRVVQETPLPGARVVQRHVMCRIVFDVQPDDVVAAPPLARVAPVGFIAEVPNAHTHRTVVEDVVEQGVDAPARRRAEHGIVPDPRPGIPGALQLRHVWNLELERTR
jgi:hypothetical protein